MISIAQEEWRKHIKTRDFYRLANLTQEQSRLLYARYQVSGVFYGNEKYFTSNPTYYTLPSSLKNKYIMGKDDMFQSLLAEYYCTASPYDDFITRIILGVKVGFDRLKERIR